jgi:hypothetical protein
VSFVWLLVQLIEYNTRELILPISNEAVYSKRKIKVKVSQNVHYLKYLGEEYEGPTGPKL